MHLTRLRLCALSLSRQGASLQGASKKYKYTMIAVEIDIGMFRYKYTMIAVGIDIGMFRYVMA